MRTTTESHPKGEGPRRRLRDDLRLLWRILGLALDYWLKGWRVRRVFQARRRAGARFYVDEEVR